MGNPNDKSSRPPDGDRPRDAGDRPRDAGDWDAGDRPAGATGLPTWPPDWPEIRKSLDECYESGDWGRYLGRWTHQLSLRLTEMAEVSHCRLVSSGSIGVELALRSLGVAEGDSVAVCAYDYPGNFRAIELLGARPLLVDAEDDGFSICPKQLGLIQNASVKAVIASHLYGVPAAIEAIRGICDDRGWSLLEDACQTPGMKIEGRPAGNWGDVSVWSFGGSKPLTSGNGGAVLSNNTTVASRLNTWGDRPSDATPMSQLQAAVLLPQIDRLIQCNQIRNECVQQLCEQVDWLDDSSVPRRPSGDATLYKFAFLTKNRGERVRYLEESGLPVGIGYRSMHRSSDRRCDKAGDLDRSALLGDQVCLLDHSALLGTAESTRRLIRILQSLS